MPKPQKAVFLFPGQGAQYVGMGRDFFDNFPEARLVFEEADEGLKQKLSSLIFSGPERELTETKNSQVAIYVVSLAILKVLEKSFPELSPSVTAGLSLGEYTALVGAKRLGMAEGLHVVKQRAELMNRACEETKGEMAVVLGLSEEQVQSMVNELHLPNDLWAANFNCPSQVVISGTPEGIARGIEEAKRRGAKRVLPLTVHGAFHSGLMKRAEEQFYSILESMPLKESRIPQVLNVTGEYTDNNPAILRTLRKQMTSSVHWEKGIRAMEAHGVDLYIEIGCGKTLANLNKRIGVQAPSLSIETTVDLDALAKVLNP